MILQSRSAAIWILAVLVVFVPTFVFCDDDEDEDEDFHPAPPIPNRSPWSMPPQVGDPPEEIGLVPSPYKQSGPVCEIGQMKVGEECRPIDEADWELMSEMEACFHRLNETDDKYKGYTLGTSDFNTTELGDGLVGGYSSETESIGLDLDEINHQARQEKVSGRHLQLLTFIHEFLHHKSKIDTEESGDENAEVDDEATVTLKAVEKYRKVLEKESPLGANDKRNPMYELPRDFTECAGDE